MPTATSRSRSVSESSSESESEKKGTVPNIFEGKKIITQLHTKGKLTIYYASVDSSNYDKFKKAFEEQSSYLDLSSIKIDKNDYNLYETFTGGTTITGFTKKKFDVKIVNAIPEKGKNKEIVILKVNDNICYSCLLYTSPSPRDS